MTLYVYRNPKGRMNLPQTLPAEMRAFAPTSLAALGWFPAEITRPPLGPDQTYTNPVLFFAGDHVMAVYPVRDLEPEEIADRVQQAAAALEEQLRALAEAVQEFLDATASARDYNNLLSACSYAASSDPTFAAEAAACQAWRDSVWQHCKAMREAVRAGLPLPTAEELIASLPPMVWPG